MDGSKTLLEAIATRRRVKATYNRQGIVIAPHILYTRHDALYVDAVTLERDGAPPRERKLGTFKLDGLGSPALAAERFEPVDLFDPADPKYAGVTLFAV